MKIKQQKQIKTFLTEEYGNEKGSAIFDRQTEILDELIKNTRGKSENQMKTLRQFSHASRCTKPCQREISRKMTYLHVCENI